MTATALIATPDDGIPTEFLEQLLRMEARFDATRPPCPSCWCEIDCETDGHFGDAVLHQSRLAHVPADPDRNGATAHLLVCAQRHDVLDEPTTGHVEIDFRSAGSLLDDRAHLTAAQARYFAAEILRHADMIDPEFKVLASDVKVGDLIQVDGAWLHVYGVMTDEPSDDVQISVTVNRVELPDFEDRDENPEHFTLADKVQIRRAGSTTRGAR